MENNYVNIRYILDKVLRHPLLQDVSLEEAVDTTIEFMRIVGVPQMFQEKVETLTLEDYRALLPCDFYNINQVALVKEDQLVPFRAANDYFITNESLNYYDLTYKIQGSIIYTSVKEGEIRISYQAIATDNEGYPLLPDNSSFIRALELYIKKKYFTILFDLGKIQSTVLSNVQQEYAWAVGDCQSEFNRMTLDKAESFFNAWRTLLIKDNEHAKNFVNTGSRQILKI